LGRWLVASKYVFFCFTLHYLNALMIFKAEVHEFSEFVGCQDKGETGVTHTFLPWESQI
jgi:hypothetical protein